MDNAKIFAALNKNAIFKGLSEEQLEEFLPLIKSSHIKANEEIIHEGCQDKVLYILVSGAVAVSKFDKDLKRDVRIITLHSGDSFGEMNLFDDSPRFATVKALFDCEVISFSIDNLDFFRSKGMSTYSIIMTNLAKQLNERLRRTTELSVSATKGIEVQRYSNSILHKHQKMLSIQTNSAKILIFSVMLIAAYLLVTNIINVVSYTPALTLGLKGISLIGCLLLFLYLIPKMDSYPNRYNKSYSFTLTKLLPLMLITLGMLVYLYLMKWTLSSVGLLQDAHFGIIPLVSNFASESNHIIYHAILVIVIILSSTLQELFMRIGQYMPLSYIIRKKKLIFFKVFLSSLLVLLIFAEFNILPVAVFLFPVIVWGYLYTRGYSLVELAVSHSIVNLCGFYIFGLWGILII